MSRQISMDSFNEPNLNSLSMQFSEQKFATHALRHQKLKTRKESELFLRSNRIPPWFPGNGRESDACPQTSLTAASIAAGIGAKVTKPTSASDLGVIPSFQSAEFPPVMMPPVNNRPQIQRQTINPPFTHGMTDNSHLDGRMPPVASVLPEANSSQRFIPSQCSVLSNSLMGMVRHPMCGGSYDVSKSMPFGYVGGGMYRGYPFSPEYMYNAYNAPPCSPFTSCNNQNQQDVLSMQPTIDSASETEFFPIKISDSEYTDAGPRSYYESQMMNSHRLMQEHFQAQNASIAAVAAASAVEVARTQPKPGLEPQGCAKTRFLQRIESFNSETMNSAVPQISRPPSGRKSPHSEAPPPSPETCSRSLNDEELDDVFDEAVEDPKDASAASLPHPSETQNVFQKLKCKFRRAASFIQKLAKPEEIELTSKTCHSSLGQLSKTSS